MSLMDRYDDARVRGDQRVANALQLRPFTCVTGFVALMSIVAGLVYTIVFSDTSEQEWNHGWRSVFVIGLLWVIAAIFYIRERKRPLPLSVRRMIWVTILIAYAVGIAYGIFLSVAAYGAKGAALGSPLYFMLRLGVLLPLAVLAWRFLRQSSANQTSQPPSSEGRG